MGDDEGGETGLDRAALSGLILLAAALFKAGRPHQARAARKLFARALARLAPLPDRWRGIDLRAMERATFAAMLNPALPTELIRQTPPGPAKTRSRAGDGP